MSLNLAMNIRFTIFLFILASFFSCENSSKKLKEEKNTSVNDTLKQERKLKPVFGYRFIISGDFDGDGKKENLIEHFFSGIDNKEINKFYENLEYDDLVDLTMKKNPYSFVLSDNKSIDTLQITGMAQNFGLSYLKNEGDLNNDGTDEVSYVVNWADWSNLNTWYLATYKNKKWQELYSFPIWDWQLPNLPETSNQYGLFGLENKIINSEDAITNNEIENELKHFKGLIKKIKPNEIQVIYRNEEADEDTVIVNLKKLKIK